MSASYVWLNPGFERAAGDSIRNQVGRLRALFDICFTRMCYSEVCRAFLFPGSIRMANRAVPVYVSARKSELLIRISLKLVIVAALLSFRV